jgi:hypothetical protein
MRHKALLVSILLLPCLCYLKPSQKIHRSGDSRSVKMSPFNGCRYSQDSSNPQSAFNYIAQPFKANNHSSYWCLDSDGSQSNGSSFAAGPDPEWFTDFILCDSDDPPIPAHTVSGPQTSEVATTPLFASLPISSLASAHQNLPNSSGFCIYPIPTEFSYTDYAAAFHANSSDLQWNPAEPALTLSTSSRSDTPGEFSQQSSPENSTLTQNDPADRPSVPRIPFLNCPTCRSLYPSESRLRYVSQT